jgi:hypothetical protein
MQTIKFSGTLVALVMIAAAPALPDDLATINKALTDKYALTTTTADKTDIVTAGCVLVLKKSNLLTIDVTKPALFGNSYKNGRITQKLPKIPGMGGFGAGTRTFVSGEKVWLTGIDVKDKGVTFTLYTDTISDVRYGGRLHFPFEKDATPTVNGVMATVAEVFDIQPSDNGGPQQTQGNSPPPGRPTQRAGVGAGGPAAAPAVEAPPPPIAPPPPPAADPKEVKMGQTPDQVTAAFGQPDKVIKLGAKQIYVYKDMKVVFVAGKVSDVQ